MPPLVVPHDPGWAESFAVEARGLTGVIGENCIALLHIGSTAIAAILAKPVIDMLGVMRSFELLDGAAGSIESLACKEMGAFGIEGRRYFRKDDSGGNRTHLLHVFKAGSPHIERHLAFSDYMRSHPDKAAEYSALKAGIVSSGAPYQKARDPFVQRIEAEALAWYRKGR